MDTRLKKALKDFLSSYIKVHNKNLTMDDIEVTFVKGFNAGQMSMKNATSTLTAKVKRYEEALIKIQDGGVPCGVQANAIERMLTMSELARAALNQTSEGEK